MYSLLNARLFNDARVSSINCSLFRQRFVADCAIPRAKANRRKTDPHSQFGVPLFLFIYRAIIMFGKQYKKIY